VASAISDLGETLCNIFYTLYLQLLYVLELSSLFFRHMLQQDIDIISGTWIMNSGRLNDDHVRNRRWNEHLAYIEALHNNSELYGLNAHDTIEQNWHWEYILDLRMITNNFPPKPSSSISRLFSHHSLK
jgi:hypothetical protein